MMNSFTVKLKPTKHEDFPHSFILTSKQFPETYILNFEDKLDYDMWISYQFTLDPKLIITTTVKSKTFVYSRMNEEKWKDSAIDVSFYEENTTFSIKSHDGLEITHFWFESEESLNEYRSKKITKLSKVQIR